MSLKILNFSQKILIQLIFRMNNQISKKLQKKKKFYHNKTILYYKMILIKFHFQKIYLKLNPRVIQKKNKIMKI